MKLAGAQVLVTGAAGMLGTGAIERLATCGAACTGIDLAPSGPGTTYAQADLAIEGALDAVAPAPPDLVLHFAAHARVHASVLDPTLARDNMLSAFHVLEWARTHGKPPVLFASSRETYGNQDRDRLREDDVRLELAASPYAASKMAGEALLHAYRRTYGLPGAIIRFSNVYGPHDVSERFVPEVVRRIRAGLPVRIYGREKSLAFTYLDDAIDGVLAVAKRLPGEVNGETFNIAGPETTSLVDVAERLHRILERPVNLRIEDSRQGEVIRFKPDLTRAERRLGFRPAVGLDDGLRRTVAWLLEHDAPATAV